MMQYIYFTAIYSMLVFIGSYVIANTRQGDKVNLAFLQFLVLILFWMGLGMVISYPAHRSLDTIFKSLYFIAMLNMSIGFLNFVYRLLERNHDYMFFCLFALNTLVIFSRYLFPIDFSTPNYWRMDEINAIIAAVMSFIFTLPMIWAVFLIIRHYIMSPRKKLKHQLKYVIIGIVLASVISIISEYLIPAMRPSVRQFSLMFLAIFVLVILLFFAIVRHQFLNVQLEYIYQRLFMFSHEGIILIDKDMSILSINQAARAIFKNVDFNGDIKLTQYIGDYDFNEDYAQHETTVQIGNDLVHLSISQSPIESEKSTTVKLLHIINITQKKHIFQMEIEQLVEQSKIDKLTGLYNKRYFIDNINDQKLQSVGKLTLVFIDIDNFKHVNDTCGHLVGDEVIKAVAKGINKVIRKNDIGIRYGGDEFLIILENTGMEDAQSITDRIQEEISTIEFDLDRLEYARCPKITISIGLCEGNKDINSLLEKADKAMYYSKSNGKNKSTVYDDSIVNIKAS